MTKKAVVELDETQENVENEAIISSENPIKNTDKQSDNGNFKNREKQIKLTKKRTERQSNDLMKFLQSNRNSYEKISFINKAYIIFQNISQISDVNVLVGDSFAKDISINLNGIINTENKIRAKINSRGKTEEIKRAIEQLEETEKIKIEIAQKLKDLNEELKQSLPKED